MGPWMFKRRIYHLNRYREIATALAKHGFGFILHDVGLLHLLSFPKRVSTDAKKGDVRTRAQRIRAVLEDLGPTFIKFGQLLSIRGDIIPEPIISELENLQDSVRPYPFEEAKKTLENELESPIEALFAAFDPEPVAAASIGQVYRATLPSGEDVAVKIQRPDIMNKIETDIEILKDLARLAEHHYEWARHYQVADIVDELADTLRDELNYVLEGRNTDRIYQQFVDINDVRIPYIHWSHCTKRVLTMEWIAGEKITHLCREDSSLEAARIANRLVDTFLMQVLQEGFFHGDPHPGNVFILPDHSLAYIDFGQVGSMDEEMRYHFSSLVIALMRQSTEGVMDATLEIAEVPDEVDVNRLRIDVDLLRQRYYDVPLSAISLGEAVNDLFRVANRHGIRIPKSYTIIAKGLLTVESIAEDLNPNLSILQIAEPYGKQLIRERFHPKNIMANAWDDFSSYAELLLQLPKQLRAVLRSVERGKVNVNIGLPDLDILLHRLDRVSNRLSFSVTLLAFSIIVVGLIIGATFGHEESIIARIPAIEIGFIVAFLMFVWIIYSILRSGRF